VALSGAVPTEFSLFVRAGVTLLDAERRLWHYNTSGEGIAEAVRSTDPVALAECALCSIDLTVASGLQFRSVALSSVHSVQLGTLACLSTARCFTLARLANATQVLLELPSSTLSALSIDTALDLAVRDSELLIYGFSGVELGLYYAENGTRAEAFTGTRASRLLLQSARERSRGDLSGYALRSQVPLALSQSVASQSTSGVESTLRNVTFTLQSTAFSSTTEAVSHSATLDSTDSASSPRTSIATPSVPHSTTSQNTTTPSVPLSSSTRAPSASVIGVIEAGFIYLHPVVLELGTTVYLSGGTFVSSDFAGTLTIAEGSTLTIDLGGARPLDGDVLTLFTFSELNGNFADIVVEASDTCLIVRAYRDETADAGSFRVVFETEDVCASAPARPLLFAWSCVY